MTDPETPNRGDGRNIDPALGLLSGEGADQRAPADRAGAEGSAPFPVWSGDGATDRVPGDATYYDRPVLKEPVWIWAVPAYFYAGGAAGAAAVLGAATQALGGRDLDGLVRKCRWVAASGGAAGTALLIHDLGRPERFLNMLRVFRPSSPLSVGSWVLAGAAPLAAASAVLSTRHGPLGATGDAAGLAAGALGLPLAGYTAVLVSNTAIPVWSEVRRSLPALFISSAVAAAAALLELFPLSPREAAVVHRYSVAGKVGELLSMVAVEREANRVERVGDALRQGVAGAILRGAKAATAASLVLSVLPGKGRAKRTAAALLGTAGSLGYKVGIWKAGPASSRDPRATFRLQRAGGGGREATGTAAVTGPEDRRATSP